MRNQTALCRVCRGAALALYLLVIIAPTSLRAAPWGSIEPFRSRRVDVERELGQPLAGQPDATGVLRFKVNGGTVAVTFVTAKFIAARGLAPDLEGTVFQIALQHENSTATPDSLNLNKNQDFKHEDRGGVSVYTNAKEGLIYTFVNGKLKTSWFNPSAEQYARSQRKKADNR